MVSVQRAYGFTIVELLIVIVVIGILASLSYVGYTNISKRANDAVVKNDLANLAKRAKVYYAENGQYPAHDYFFTAADGVSVGKSSYDVAAYNLYYCVNTGRSEFGIAARSKSRQTYITSSTISLAENPLTPQWQVACGAFGETELGNVRFSYGYNLSTGEWLPSIGG